MASGKDPRDDGSEEWLQGQLDELSSAHTELVTQFVETLAATKSARESAADDGRSSTPMSDAFRAAVAGSDVPEGLLLEATSFIDHLVTSVKAVGDVDAREGSELQARLRQCYMILLGQDTPGNTIRNCLRVIDSASRDVQMSSPESRGLHVQTAAMALVLQAWHPLLRSDPPDTLAVAQGLDAILNVWGSPGGRANERKWELVAQVFQEIGLQVTSATALKMAWKRTRSIPDPG